MTQAEASAFARGVNADDLMERAGLGIARAVAEFFPAPAHALVVCGKGHNAGDVLVAARHLADRGWSISLDLAFPANDLSPLPARHLAAVAPLATTVRPAPAPQVVLDGLLGIGARGVPRHPVAEAIQRVNAHRARGAFVVAADVPSGLDADSGQPAEPCVVADLTVTIGHAKAGLVADAATNHVGRLELVPLADLPASGGDTANLVTPALLRPLLPPRPFDSHKGTWGRVGIIAGSRGYLGAARLCATGALRAGAGLVSLYVPPDIYPHVLPGMPPEIMVRPVSSYALVFREKHDALALGPGLGASPDMIIRDIVTRFRGPMVVDADALNLLARYPYAWLQMAGPRLFTPHPGEMARLFPASRDLSRRAAAEQYAAKHPLTLLLKGARTVIATKNRPTLFNTTGNPGMGSGGMGDVLTGVCAAFLARGMTPPDAAALGAWICGRAAERFVFGAGGSPESLTASDVLAHLGGAFRDVYSGGADAG